MSAPNLTFVVEYGMFPGLRSTMHFHHTVGTPDEDVLEEARLAGCTQPAILAKEWERWAWPGGYPLYYLLADGGVLCNKCANTEIKLTSDPEADDEWRLVGVDINYEDDHLVCDHCGEHCESAYGEPEGGRT